MADEDDIVVVVEGEDEAIVKTTEKEVNDDPVADLKSQLSEMNSRVQAATQQVSHATQIAQQATQRAETLEREVQTVRTQVVDREFDTVLSGIAAAKAEADRAEQLYTQAFEAGDGKAMAKAQREIAEAAARQVRLEEARADLESSRKTKPEPEPRQQQFAPDPVEEYVKGRTPMTADWIRKHPEFVTDQRKNAKLTGAHWDAVGEGLQPDTPEYFSHVEKFVGIGAEKKPEPQSQRRPSTMAAPVTPSGGGMDGNSNRVSLKSWEAKAATDGTHVWNYDDPTGKGRFKKGDPIGNAEFARRKQIMMKEGRYSADKTES